MKSKTELCIMYSGGLDSFIAKHYAISQGYDPKLVYVDLGHPNAKQEMAQLPEDVEVLTFHIYESIRHRLVNQIIPSRNMLFATIGGMFARRVWLIALDGEQNGKERDKSDYFFNRARHLLTFLNDFFQDRTIVETPFRLMSKKEAIRWALDNGVSAEDMLATRSCYGASEQACGTCLTCVKRHMAFALNGIDDGLGEKVQASEYFDELLTLIPKAEALKDYSRFSEKRIAEFNDYLKLIRHDNSN